MSSRPANDSFHLILYSRYGVQNLRVEFQKEQIDNPKRLKKDNTLKERIYFYGNPSNHQSTYEPIIY